MPDDIFHLRGSELVRLRSERYEAEALLQQMLAEHPDVLASGSGGEPLLLVNREVAIADTEDGAGRWSIDHLFVDAAAMPTLVEVKRSTDTRLRREVVGQLLDYAAHATAYWSAAELRATYEAAVQKAGEDPDERLVAFVGEPDVAESFWQQVEDNLRAGKVRLVLVSDDIPKEVRRVIEFLNEQMSPAEALAVEVKQYVSEGGERTLVPRRIGETLRGSDRRTTQRSHRWTLDEMLIDLGDRGLDQAAQVVGRLADELPEHGELMFNRGATQGSFGLRLPTGEAGEHAYLATIRSTGQVMVAFNWLKRQAPFDDPAAREQLRIRLESIPGVDLGGNIDGQPVFDLELLADPAQRKVFLATVAWTVNQLRQAAPAPER